jgi:hypothetical protein
MLKLQRALRERNFAMTHLDLLRAAHPTLANCYSTVLKRDLTPSQRFQAISEKLFSFSEFVGQLDSHERMTQLPAVSSVIDASTNQQRGPPVLLIDRLKGFFNSKKTEMAIKKMVGDATAATFAASGNLPQLMTTLQSADSKYVSLSVLIKIAVIDFCLNKQKIPIFLNRSKERVLSQVDFATASPYFTDACLTMLATNGGLTELRLRNCVTLDNTRLIAILRVCPKLSVVDLRGCKKVSHGHLIREDALQVGNIISLVTSLCDGHTRG